MDTVSQSISPGELAATVGTRSAPLLIDVRKAEAFAESDYLLPGSIRWDYNAGAEWPPELSSSTRAVAYCVKGAEVGIQGAALLASKNKDAAYLRGGLRDWQAAGFLIVRKRPDLGVDGERVSRWVTRERPKIDRIACPWLVRRFIDRRAQFFYVPKAEVFAFAKANNAIAYDIPGAPLEHDRERCSFDAFINAFELKSPALNRVADIVRAADTDTLERSPQAAGLLAISLGFSRMFADDHAMLDAMFPVYDALYEWALAAEQGEAEPHRWTPEKAGASIK